MQKNKNKKTKKKQQKKTTNNQTKAKTLNETKPPKQIKTPKISRTVNTIK